jgi:hypothetical protein
MRCEDYDGFEPDYSRNMAKRHATALCKFLRNERAQEVTIPVNLGPLGVEVYSVKIERHFAVDAPAHLPKTNGDRS